MSEKNSTPRSAKDRSSVEEGRGSDRGHKLGRSPEQGLERNSSRAVSLLRLLATFTGWATLDSVEGIATLLADRSATAAESEREWDPISVSLWMAELVDSGLVEMRDTRTDILVTEAEPELFRVREEARELLRRRRAPRQSAARSDAELQAAHDHWFREQAEVLGPRLRTRREPDAQRRLDFEFPEYLAALDTLIDEDPRRALRAVNRLGDFWVPHGQTRSGARLLKKTLRALGLDDGGFAEGPFEVVRGQSLLAHMQLRAEHLSNLEEYQRWLISRLDAAFADPALRRRDQFAIALHLVFAAMVARDYETAIRTAERCRDLALEIGDDFHAGNFNFFLARVSEQAGDDEAAAAYIERAIVHARRTGVESFLAICISEQTLLLRDELSSAQVAQTLGPIVESHLRNRRVRDAALVAVPLALAQFHSDQRVTALETLRLALLLSKRIRFFDGELTCVALIAFSELSAESTPENVERCARLYGGFRHHMGRFRATIAPHYAAMIDDAVEGLRAMLGSAQLERITATAPSSWAEVIAEAEAFVVEQLEELKESTKGVNGLTPREQIDAGVRELAGREGDVLELLLQGMSDKRIAEKLALKPNTVRSYNSRIFRKFGVTSRSELLALYSVDRARAGTTDRERVGAA